MWHNLKVKLLTNFKYLLNQANFHDLILLLGMQILPVSESKLLLPTLLASIADSAKQVTDAKHPCEGAGTQTSMTCAL